MSPRKPKASSTALVPIEQGRALPASFRERFAAFRQKQADSTPGSMGLPTIRAANGVFTFPGGQAGVKTFEAVVLCGLRANTYFEGRYVPGSEDRSPPVCTAMAALGEHENSMAPFEGCAKPQSATCATCARNVAPQKDCRNGIALALLSVDQLANVKAAPIARLRLSATAIGPFGTEVRMLRDDHGAAPFFAAWRFWQEQPEGASYWTTRCAPSQWLPEAAIEAVSERVEEAAAELLRAARPLPQAAGGEGEAGKPGPLPARRKKAGRAKAGGRKL